METFDKYITFIPMQMYTISDGQNRTGELVNPEKCNTLAMES